METFDLRQEAILVRLVIGQAGLSARSRTLTAEAAVAHNADPNSVRGIVQKLESTARAEITQAINQARATFYANTLPWDDNAYRLCPLTRYNHLRKELHALQNAFADAVDALVDRYAELQADYHRRVNDLAQEIPFPTQAKLRNSFRFELIEMPLPNLNDVRLRHVDSSVVDDLRTRVEKQMSERLAEAQGEIVTRLADLVDRVKVQTAKDGGRIFASLIGNIEEAVNVLPSLNVSNDPEINRLISKVKNELTHLDVEAIRKDDNLRMRVANTASDMLDELRSFRVASNPAVIGMEVAPAAPVAPAPVVPAPPASAAPVAVVKATKKKAAKVAEPKAVAPKAVEPIEDDFAAALSAPAAATVKPIVEDDDLKNFASFV